MKVIKMKVIKETLVGNRLVRTWEKDSPLPYRTDIFRRGKPTTSGPTQNYTRQGAEESHDVAVDIAKACLLFRQKKRPSLRRERALEQEVEQLQDRCQELENEVSILRGEKGILPGHYIRAARRAIVGILMRGDPITAEDLSKIRQGVSYQELLHIGRALITRLQKRVS